MKIFHYVKSLFKGWFTSPMQDSSAKAIIAEINKILEERDTWKDKANYWETVSQHHEAERERLGWELEKYTWRPIETFDHRMFSVMTGGIPDSCEVVKYKGEVPEWANMWIALPPIPRKT